VEPAPQNLLHQGGTIGSLPGSFFAPALEPFSGALSGERDGADLEMNVTLVVHGHFEYEHIGPLDLGINDLTVQVVDIGHAKVGGDRLSVGISYFALDAPLALRNRDHRIASNDLIASGLSVPTVDETHVGVVQRVIDVVEVIANAIQAHHVQADIRAFKFWISWQQERITFAKVSEDKP